MSTKPLSTGNSLLIILIILAIVIGGLIWYERNSVPSPNNSPVSGSAPDQSFTTLPE